MSILNGIKQKSPDIFYNIFSHIYMKSHGANISYPVYINPFNLDMDLGDNVQIGKSVTLKGNITLKDNVKIEDCCNLLANNRISIGRNSKLGKGVDIRGNVSIGNYCAIARNSTFQEANHYMQKPAIDGRFYREVLNDTLGKSTKGPINIGSDVWVGTSAIVLSGVNIGHGSIVGAGAVVTKDVEPYSIVAGVPAVHKKYRFPEHVREQLLEIKWWCWDERKIKKNRTFFSTDISEVDDLYDLLI